MMLFDLPGDLPKVRLPFLRALPDDQAGHRRRAPEQERQPREREPGKPLQEEETESSQRRHTPADGQLALQPPSTLTPRDRLQL